MTKDKVFTTDEKLVAISELKGNLPESLLNFLKTSSDLAGISNGEMFVDVFNENFKDLATFYIPKENETNLVFRLDYITSIRNIELNHFAYHESMPETAKKEFVDTMTSLEQAFRAKVEEYGYKWYFAHETSQFEYAWWDLIIPIKNWDLEKFMELWAMIDQLNVELTTMLDTYGF